MFVVRDHFVAYISTCITYLFVIT